jgi:hypothetical protein
MSLATVADAPRTGIKVAPELTRMVRGSAARAIKDDTTRTTAARKAYRAKIGSLLDESRDERLADAWQRVYPCPMDPAHELPDRRGIIEDLADFAEALQPSLDGMQGDRLCRLIEEYAACDSRQSDLPVSCRDAVCVDAGHPSPARGSLQA